MLPGSPRISLPKHDALAAELKDLETMKGNGCSPCASLIDGGGPSSCSLPSEISGSNLQKRGDLVHL